MLDNIHNILMIRRGAIGDIIFTLPAYHMLRANFPAARITYLVKDSYAPVLQGFPGLDEVLVIRKKDLASRKVNDLWRMGTELLRAVRSRNFQLAVDFVGHGEHALLLWLSGIEHRWASIKTRKPVRELFYTTYFVRELENVHLADQHLRLLERGGLTPFPVRNEYAPPPENVEKAKALFSGWGLSPEEPTLFIQPFTGEGVAGKMWPLERYVAVAAYWRARGRQVLFGGGPAERERLKAVAGRFPVAAGQADFLTSVALAALSSLVLGGDTGLLHAAQAAGKRVVMLVGPTNRFRAGPYGHPEWAVRPPSGHSIEAISVDKVIESCDTARGETCQGLPRLS